MSKLALINPAMSLPKNKEDEFRIKVGLRNNRLIALREAKGLTQIEAAKMMRMSVGCLNGFECLRNSPLNKVGVFSLTAQRIADFYETKVSWIFPDAIEQIVNRDLEFTRSAEEMPDIFQDQRLLVEQSTPMQLLESKTTQENLYKMLSSLSPRQEIVLRMRFFENATLEDVGKALGITRSRVTQIENTALRLLRHPSRRSRIAGDDSMPPPRTCCICKRMATGRYESLTKNQKKYDVCHTEKCRLSVRKKITRYHQEFHFVSLMGRTARTA